MSSEFAPRTATKEQRKARIFLSGPSNAGKTKTSLKWARVLAGPAGTIVLVDTENDAALDYADDPEVGEWQHVPLPAPYTVERYQAAIAGAMTVNPDVLIVDSSSHAWAGKGGLLGEVDAYAKRNKGDSFGAWRDVTPRHQDFVEGLMALPTHLIVTARAKQDYQLEQRNGKWQPVKLGLAPIQREGLDYEFSLVGEMDADHHLRITKHRVDALDGYEEDRPGPHVAQVLLDWLGQGRSAGEVVEQLYGEVMDATTTAELVALREKARAKAVGAVPVADPDSGDKVPLDQLIAARGRRMWEAEQAARTGVTA